MHANNPPPTARSRQVLNVLATCLLPLVAVGCSYSGGIENPLTRKATWFSYLNGDDVRERCAQAPERFEVRLIYNGNFKEQVRTYDIRGTADGGARATVRAMPPEAGNLVNFRLRDPLATGRWKTATTTLDAQARARLTRRLADSGVFQRAPSGIDLKSWGSYWVAVACRDGRLTFNAWKKGGERWDRQNLRAAVAPLDATGVPFYAPHPARFEDSPTVARTGEDRRRPATHFLMTTGDNGLVGLP